ncbi:hypothetical protein QAD02_006433 [Eretmocerus hayati]|uniref:Uncharacterized protein n=1 Tax=Eretmocerus hayati TaxID=131215 RepID=A0ACC2N1P8_9HYME|nr:hypothetical protein QAD02_006433 [Eretmocerus hayati]
MMRFSATFSLFCVAIVSANQKYFNQNNTNWKEATSIYDFHAKDIDGNDVSLEKYKGHVVIIVNVASKCGLAHTNYEQLQVLYNDYAESNGLRILAFPCNQFNNQEPGTPEEIKEFIKKHGVTFDIFDKIDVNGPEAHPLYQWLVNQKFESDFLSEPIEWNFVKFLINKEGKVVDRFGSKEEPFAMEYALQHEFDQ